MDSHAKDLGLKDVDVQSRISKAKAKGLSPAQLDLETPQHSQIGKIVVRVYAEYETILKRNNSLDFDDLLIHGVRLFARVPKSIAWCRHVLVDEL